MLEVIKEQLKTEYRRGYADGSKAVTTQILDEFMQRVAKVVQQMKGEQNE